MRLRSVTFFLLMAVIAGSLVFAHPSLAASTAINPTCKEVSKQPIEELTPPRLYFLPFCDQTPVYVIDSTSKQLLSDCPSDSKTCKKYDKYCREVRPCQPDDFVQTFVNMSSSALIALPIVAMLFFIWGGFNLITSGGNPEKIQQGKRMILGVVLGVIIILILAWMWANFVVFILTGSSNVFPGTNSAKPWWGGGTGSQITPVTTPGTGCCVTLQGCLDAESKTGCDKYMTDKTYCIGSDCSTAWIQATECSQYEQCQNLDQGCCVPYDTTKHDCVPPEPVRGCSTVASDHYLRDQTSCASITQCQP